MSDVIELRDMFELRAKLSRLEELWPDRAAHLEEVNALLDDLAAQFHVGPDQELISDA